MNRFLKRFNSKSDHQNLQSIIKEYNEADRLEDLDGKDKATKKLLSLVDKDVIKNIIKYQDSSFKMKEELISYIDHSDIYAEFKEFLVVLFDKKEIKSIKETFWPVSKYSEEQIVRHLTIHEMFYEEIIGMVGTMFILDIDIQRPNIDKDLEMDSSDLKDFTLTGARMKIDVVDRDLKLIDASYQYAISFDSFMSEITGSKSTEWEMKSNLDDCLEILSTVIIEMEWYKF